MPINQSQETAIARFRAMQQIEVNEQPVYATYTSGHYNAFYATEEEAIAHCDKSESGCEFNGQWFQDQYNVYQPGELFAVPGNDSVYVANDRSRYIDAIGGRWQMPFVTWRQESPFAA